MKTLADGTDRSSEDAGQFSGNVITQPHFFAKQLPQGDGKSPQDTRYTRLLPRATFIAMMGALLLMDAVIPLRGLWFHEALLTQMGWWPVAPSLLLFPGWNVIPPISSISITSVPDISSSWETLAMLLGAFSLVFLIYLFAVNRLSGLISRRFIMRSTLIIGLLFMLVPVVTSPDLYSYIAYARIGIIYHMNPLTTIPQAIHNDVIYSYVSWVDQPSAYGPAWTLLTCFFQLITSLCGLGNLILSMVLILRAWGLFMHLCSVALIWSIGGSLQRLHGIVSQEKRLLATLAFAWNPLLLLEACTNAHNDTTLLFLMLLAIWFLVSVQIEPDRTIIPRWMLRLGNRLSPTTRARLVYLTPSLLLALGTCLKINLVLLAPGLFFYQWLQTTGQPLRQRLKRAGSSIASYTALIIILYAPFWQGGAIFTVFATNPGTSRTINTFADSAAHLYNSVSAMFGFPVGAPIGSPAERFIHTLSIGLFVLIYAVLCWQILRNPSLLRNIHGLIRWMAITWLLYCSIGSPWFWPWYLTTFFGLYALIEASKPAQTYLEEEFTPQPSKQISFTRLFKRMQTFLLHPNFIRALVFSMFTLYCFTTWGPLHSFVPGLPAFQWSYLNGLWAWTIPLAALIFTIRTSRVRQRSIK